MIRYFKHTLTNGLRVVIHRDTSTPMAVINLLYDVGSKDEHPERTGISHLLEHLMFGGSVNIPSYDREIQRAAGENNAFTNNDITNYYLQVPSANIETGFWLESDRMLGLRFSKKTFDTQKQVVIEEFRQRYLNQPYGDIWLLLRPLAYEIHPYRWPTIGSNISHIENITLTGIRQYYSEHYCPSNAILSVAGNVNEKECVKMIEKWFGHIPPGKKSVRSLPAEPRRKKARKMVVSRDVPYHELVIACGMCGRNSAGYYAFDLISDLLAGGKSSLFYRNLIMESKKFSNIDAYITGDIDPGLFIIRGRVSGGIEPDDAHNALLELLKDFMSRPPEKYELNKVKNKLEATRQYAHTDNLHKAIDIAFHELLGDAGNINREIGNYRKVTPQTIQTRATKLFDPDNMSTLFYNSGK